MYPDVEIMERVFLFAMGEGYAKGVPTTSIAQLPDSRVVTIDTGDFRVTDCYFTTPRSDKSSGQTTMWYGGRPVWTMHYGGRYATIAIPFLKECLLKAYVKEKRFYGGRGPKFIRNDRFTYVNVVRRESFDDFEGEERIFDLNDTWLGYHWYRGMSLL